MNSHSTVVLENARIILPDREIEAGSVLVDRGLITAITDGPGETKANALELSGLTLLPGFIDVHIHGAVGIDTMDASAEQLGEIAMFLATQGVTSWLPTFVPATTEQFSRAVGEIAKSMNVEPGARVLGVHYEGPFVNSAQCGALHKEYFKTYSGPEDLACLSSPENAVRMITLAPEISGGVELVRELKARGWVISIGHTRADLKVLDEACDAGARHMTHFMNAMPSLHHRAPGPVGWGLSRDDVTFDVIADGIHLDPFMLRLLVKTRGVRGITLISDAIAAAGRGDGDYRIWGETIAVKNGRTANPSGSIAGSVISMLDAVRLMHSLGVSYVDLAQMASSNPARLLGVDDECGSIEVGKRADLVALDQNGNVGLTLIGGRPVS
ncbi:MAG TPA: N-acetylglucosamine-6-phosphate deacetylase [Pyrinomonadaceae bacterium]|nr:N-acetylglucosamine-6-phosphate deacetylase [Pyrinomonadaceae bacterium]